MNAFMGISNLWVKYPVIWTFYEAYKLAKAKEEHKNRMNEVFKDIKKVNNNICNDDYHFVTINNKHVRYERRDEGTKDFDDVVIYHNGNVLQHKDIHLTSNFQRFERVRYI